ncbi:isopenicillin N synthase family oxygenase [Leptolyngbya sp. FACHB-261]|uniref:isopenicillin N synthase family dioxygenase n=1 Tax=Leptolyngbya sp. FACHB-261 TaxID=2692806 RepID=UPI00168606C2|nr:isopenicillin N synthase family oxygenase [Leptolyngbya sp. FACHB-261]MBD2104693.1 isopenicillin N synthase family oxygenase [Leptolyngbya sp. FACHB-261]
MPVQIPVIDFEPFLIGDQAAQRAVAQQIHQTCHELGFMYLKNIGISQTLIEQFFNRAQSFFALPSALKEQVTESRTIAPGQRCVYMGLGTERSDPSQPDDLKETFDIFREEGYYQEAFVHNPNPPAQTLTEQTNLQTVGLEFQTACTEASYQVLRAFALGLDLPESFFQVRHGQNNILRLIHYPPLHQEPEPGQLRSGTHTDYGSFTLLFQDNVGGLEICTAQGEWIAAPPIPGTVIVNIGDLLQQWTNQELRSTWHRVAIPTGAKVQQSRYSSAFFCEPNNDVEVACLSTCQGPERPPLHAPVIAGEHLRERAKETINALNDNALNDSAALAV